MKRESFLKSLNVTLDGVAIAGHIVVSLHDKETRLVSFRFSGDLYFTPIKAMEVENTSIMLHR
jgi:hypothetical protein